MICPRTQSQLTLFTTLIYCLFLNFFFSLLFQTTHYLTHVYIKILAYQGSKCYHYIIIYMCTFRDILKSIVVNVFSMTFLKLKMLIFICTSSIYKDEFDFLKNLLKTWHFFFQISRRKKKVKFMSLSLHLADIQRKSCIYFFT